MTDRAAKKEGVKWFGKGWAREVPLVDQLPVPVGEPCCACERPFEATDRGVAIPMADESGAIYYHRNCIAAWFTPFHLRMHQQLERSWCFQAVAERRARMRAVTALVLELDRIRKVDIFSTKIGESCIEAVIEGDWQEARWRGGALRFEDRYAPLWATFVGIVVTECDEAAVRARGEAEA